MAPPGMVILSHHISHLLLLLRLPLPSTPSSSSTTLRPGSTTQNQTEQAYERTQCPNYERMSPHWHPAAEKSFTSQQQPQQPKGTYFFLSLSFLKGCWEQLCSAWPMSVSAATFLLLNEFISSSSSRRFSSRFLFSL